MVLISLNQSFREGEKVNEGLQIMLKTDSSTFQLLVGHLPHTEQLGMRLAMRE